MMRKVLVLFLLTAGLSAYGKMDRLYFNSLSADNGLSDNLVFSIAQDKDGLIWFGTAEGLNRYDGYDFNVFCADPDDPTSLSASYINSVRLDRKGRLWVGTEKGLNLYDSEAETFRRISAVNDTLDLINNLRIRCIYDTPDGILWLGTLDGLLKLDVEERYVSFFRLVPQSHGRMSNEIRCICSDGYGRLWLGTFDGLYWFNPKDNSIIRYDTRPRGGGFARNNLINSLYIPPDEPSELWIGSSDGLSVMDLEDPGRIVFSMQAGPGALAGNDVKSILEYSPGVFLIATAGGLSMLDASSGETATYKSSLTDVTSLPDDSIRTMFRSSDGVIWLGTDKGVSRIDLNMKKIDFFNVVSSGEGPEHRYRINDLACIGSRLWMSTNEGLLVYDTLHPERQPRRYTVRDGLSHRIVKSLCVDDCGTVWCGTDDGLDRYDPEADRFVKVSYDESPGYSLKYVYEIKKLPGGGIVTNINSGLCFIYPELVPDGRPAGYRFRRCSIAGLINSDNSDVAVFDVDGNGNVWFSASDEGFFRYDAQTGEIRMWAAEPGNDRSLASNRVYSIEVGSSGKVWLGTNRGLCCYDPETDLFDRFTDDIDLSASIRTVVSDSSGRIWAATINRLIMYDPATSEKIICDLKHDLNLDEIRGESCAADSLGCIYMGGDGGFIRFDPDLITRNETTSRMLITSFSLWNRPVKPGVPADGRIVLPSSVMHLDRIRLAHNQNTFSFRFSLLNYSSPVNNRYSYRLSGYDKDWTLLTGNVNSAGYSNLPPGRYRFEVMGCNSDRVWSSDAAGIDLRIMPPWWASWWARLIYALLACVFIYYVMRFFVMRMRLSSELQLEKMERAKLEELNNIKMQFFTNISHEFKTPLSLILGPLETLTAQIHDKAHKAQLRMMKHNAENLLRLVNQIMDMRKYDNGKLTLHPAVGEFVSFSRMIWGNFVWQAERRNITYEFEAYDDTLNFMFDGDKMEKVYNNLISNAIKFTPDGGHITVSLLSRVRDGNREAVVSVRDDGAGIPPEEASHVFDRFYQGSARSYEPVTGSGIGLVLTKEYIELHGGTISLDSAPGGGSVFTFVLPCRLDAESGTGEGGQETVVKEKGKEYRILVVEDNPDMRRFIRMTLEDEYAIDLAEDGQTGLGKIRDTNPDLVISDVMMPGMDGMEMCRRVKADVMTEHIPVILLTAKGDEESRAEGYAAGADGYINKPFSVKTLRTRISSLIAQRRKLQEKTRMDILASPSEIKIESESDRFIVSLVKAVEDHIDDSEFGIRELCDSTKYSHQQVYRKVKALTGESVNEFIRDVRLKRAAQYLEQGDMRISDVMYGVGFSSHSYFTKCFREKFGVSPKEYAETHKKQE